MSETQPSDGVAWRGVAWRGVVEGYSLMDATAPDDLAELFRLHTLLLAGDCTVRDLLAQRMYPRLMGYLEARHWVCDTDLITDAVADTLMAYLAHPGGVSAADGGTLVACLVRSAWHDVLNVSVR